MEMNCGPVFEKNLKSTGKIVINRGGTRSGKTYSLLQLLLNWLVTGVIDESGKHFEKGIATVVRKEKTTLKATCMRDREEIIVSSGAVFLLGKEHRNLTDKVYTYQGRRVEFIGADDQQKLRGGKRDILYCNEANSLNYDQEFFQLFIRTTYKTFIDFNPDNEDIWINEELEQKRRNDKGDVDIIVSTYRDNPYLPEQQVEEIERLEKNNPRYWRIYGLGEYGKLEGVIFDNREIIEDVPENAQFIGRGLDWGFTNDPTAVVDVYKWRVREGWKGESIVLDERVYKHGMLNSDIDSRMRALDMHTELFIAADSAEPKSIEELYRLGWNIHPVEKGKDSIVYGVNTMLQYKIYVTSRSQNLIRELKGYCWDVDKEGKHMNKPADGMDHAIDAARYLFMAKLGIKKPTEKKNTQHKARYNPITGQQIGGQKSFSINMRR